MAKPLPKLLFITDEKRHPTINDILFIIEKLPKHSGVIFRHYNHVMRNEFAKILREDCYKKDLIFIVAGDEQLAKNVNADGIHLPEWMVKEKSHAPLWAINNDKLLTVAAHSPKALEQAHSINADAALLSPVLETKSHQNADVIGIDNFIKWCDNSPIPVYALGGINKQNEVVVQKANIIGIASSGAFWD